MSRVGWESGSGGDAEHADGTAVPPRFLVSHRLQLVPKGVVHRADRVDRALPAPKLPAQRRESRAQ